MSMAVQVLTGGIRSVPKRSDLSWTVYAELIARGANTAYVAGRLVVVKSGQAQQHPYGV